MSTFTEAYLRYEDFINKHHLRRATKEDHFFTAGELHSIFGGMAALYGEEPNLELAFLQEDAGYLAWRAEDAAKTEHRNFNHPKRNGDERRKSLLKEKKNRLHKEELCKERRRRKLMLEKRGRSNSPTPTIVDDDF